MVEITSDNRTPAGPVPWRNANLFAAAAMLIGIVVLPTDIALNQGGTVASVVFARAFWACLTVSAVVLASGNGRALLKKDKAHLTNVVVRGIGLGLVTIYAYSAALAESHATPVIVAVVGISGIVGMAVSRPPSLTFFFFPLSIVVPLAGALNDFHGTGQLTYFALGMSVLAGAIYGLLPYFVRKNDSNGIATVAQYLFVAACLGLIPVAHDFWGNSGAAFSAVFHPSAIAAGVLCTGIPYMLMEIALSSRSDHPRLPGSWATLLYGFEPVTVLFVSVFIMQQPMSLTAALFTLAFMILSVLVGPVLSKTNCL